MMNRNMGQTWALFGDSLRDVAEYLHSTPDVWGSASIGSRARHQGTSWDMGADYQAAWKLAYEGWTQGAVDLDTAVHAIEPDAVLPELRWDFGGERVDIPRYLGGDPACMISKGRQTRQRPVVHLVVNGSVSCSVSAKAIAAYGAALTAIIDTIENAGRRVELDLVYALHDLGAGWGGKMRGLVGWKVKAAEDHCDMASIAFAIAHPAAFRRIGFALIERLPKALRNDGYGRPGKITKEDLAMLGMEGAFILPGVGASDFGIDPKAAIPRAIAQINEVAGEEIVSAA